MPYTPPKKTKIQYHISEVAKMFEVNISLIRYWEKEFTILKPHKDGRGTRYFKPKDIDNLHLIYNLLKEQGLTLEGAKKKLKDNREQTFKNFDVIKRLKHIKAKLLLIQDELDAQESTSEATDTSV